MVTKSVEHKHSVQKVRSSNPSRVKPVTYQIDTCGYLAWRLALIGYEKDWLAQCQDSVTVRYRVMVLVAGSPSGAAL